MVHAVRAPVWMVEQARDHERLPTTLRGMHCVALAILLLHRVVTVATVAAGA